jgi:hypothetical protein
MAVKLIPESIREVLEYRPDTGDFVWLVTVSPKAAKGSFAGFVNKKTGYKSIGYCGTQYRANRVAWFLMTGEQPPPLIDHEDRDKLNNKWRNLRALSYKGNAINRTARAGKCKGVRWNGREGLWYAQITNDGNQLYLYSGADFFEACCARKSAENRHHLPVLE